MSFRKRNIVLSQSGASNIPSPSKAASLPGIRSSQISGTQITSTGTASLDKLLAVGGIALGSSLLVEEEGTTDFSSSLLRCFAAEGVLQGHAVFVVAPEGSVILPGEVEEKESRGKSKEAEDKMKIAWRVFSFHPDLIKTHPATHFKTTSPNKIDNSFPTLTPSLSAKLVAISSSPQLPPRSPYPPPNHTSAYDNDLMAFGALSTGASVDSLEPTASSSGGSMRDEEKMQGLLKLLKAPVLSERSVGVGGLGVGNGEDMAFAVGRKRFIIRPFHLPPVEGEGETSSTTEEKQKVKDLEF
ncbi:hypothetical protein FKW77_004326 [Venturia effusa]|uniref:Elongator complex protein 4 n=1 Tax=Venturia effusa TaxID=50376 RepID=A0A517LC88_9PEZI|nr:hypothetical protein FKW77_004326 [Venturia effusa]